MKQTDFDKIPTNELLRLVSRHPAGSTKIGLSLLGDDAQRWWNFRKKAEMIRLVDPKTGAFVSQFDTKEHRYYIRTAEQGVGMRRYVELKKGLSMVGFNVSLPEQLAGLRRIKEAANTLVTPKPRLDNLFAEIQNQEMGLSAGNRKWDYSYFVCTLFIVREDEDLTKWDESLAEQKIEDWAESNIHEQDFFLLSMLYQARLNEWWKELQAKSDLLVRQFDQMATAG